MVTQVRALYISLEHRDFHQGDFKELRLEIHLYDTSRSNTDEERMNNATEILKEASCVPPKRNLVDRNARIVVQATKNFHGERGTMKEPGQLR